jgi:hypothetical protein
MADSAYIQELRHQANSQFVQYWREFSDVLKDPKKDDIEHMYKAAFICGALEASKSELLIVENRLEASIRLQESIAEKITVLEEQIAHHEDARYKIMLEAIGPEAAKCLKGSYTKEGVISWFKRKRQQLDGLSAYEIFEQNLEAKFEIIKQLALNLRLM